MNCYFHLKSLVFVILVLKIKHSREVVFFFFSLKWVGNECHFVKLAWMFMLIHISIYSENSALRRFNIKGTFGTLNEHYVRNSNLYYRE